MKKTSHEFALYVPRLSELSALTIGQRATFNDPDLHHRLVRVLRLAPSDRFVMFCDGVVLTCEFIEAAKKDTVSLCILKKEHISKPKTHIIFLLPLLKSADRDAAISVLTSMGVDEIQLVLTEKVQRSWHGPSDAERIQRLVIAAAEQAKRYRLPLISAPLALTECLQRHANADAAIFFDGGATPLLDLLCDVTQTSKKKILLLVGPEGDLTGDERQIVKQASFISCALTPTVLRAWHAAALGAGIFRSLFPE